ncbi:MAG: flavin reductase [Desulfofustis sp.]
MIGRINIGAENVLYPSLTTIVGVDVNGHPNWITIAHVGILNQLAHAPMIRECPLSMELKLKDVLTLGHHEIFVGEIVNTFAQKTCLTDEKPDLEKINPILFDMMKLDYWALGQRTGKPWRDGKNLKEKA